MQRGDRVADRFDVEQVVAAGGAGAVYRALDRTTGLPVALTVLRSGGREYVERLGRDIRMLADLDHPAIVRYVAQGSTLEGQPYVAVEWLEGELLGTRLARADLAVAEALTVGRRLASGLAAAHARGVVHRDLSPSNVLLVGGVLEQAKILGFGLARLEPVTTLSGTIAGTPGYMAPEQARGLAQIDARADVFALGCLLFKALTGRGPFEEGHAVAALARVLFEHAPRARRLRGDIPHALDDLISRMTARDRDERPRDGREVQAELAEIDPLLRGSRPPPGTPSGGVLTIEEQRLVSVVLALAKEGANESLAERARAAAAPFGAKLERLADGTLVAALSSKGSARDQAKQAARCALQLRDVLEGAPLALATGRASRGSNGIVGEVVERAAKLLRRTEPPPAPGRRTPAVLLDDVTAGLLDAQFDVVGDETRLGLRRERGQGRAESGRTLLGSPTPFVGREREMSLLEAIFNECVGDRVAHAVLITAASGLGKSRLRHEFLENVRRRDDGKPVEVWIGRGDPMSVGSPFGMLAQVVRATSGVVEGETLRTRQTKLGARLSRHLSGSDHARVAEFLGELAGIRFPEAKSVQLQAARRSAVLMGDQMRRAWEDFLAAECAAQPVLLVLEDLHWGDLPTVSFVDAALRVLREMPLMVVATARPEVHQLFPQLWAERPLTELRLAELSRKASEKLVRLVLRSKVQDDTVARVVEQSGGNAFYLEELIRSVAEGHEDELPPTVLAMVQSRLEGLDPEARRVLRAASVFGERFWKGGVTHLLADAEHTLSVGEWLTELTKRELIAPRERGRFPDEYVFRHAILREAAYATLTDTDCALGHGLAAEWLEKTGETDAMTLAEQLVRGGEPGRATAYFLRAAVQALEGNDLTTVIARAKRGIACGAQGADRGALRVLQAEAHRWRGELAEAEACGLEALESIPRGTALWFDAAGELASSAGRLSHHEPIAALVEPLCDDVAPEVAPHQVIAWARTAVPLLAAGQSELADRLFSRIERVDASQFRQDPGVLARMHQARALLALGSGDRAGYLELTEAAAAAFEQAGDLRSACLQRMNAGYAKMTLGAHAAAEQALRASLATAERLGLHTVVTAVRHNLGKTLALRGALHEGRAAESLAIEAAAQQGDMVLAATSRIYLAEILMLGRNRDGAERELLAALDVLGNEPSVRAHALACLSRLRAQQGRQEEALATAEQAMKVLRELGRMTEGEALVRLSYAEALLARGDKGRAREVIREAGAKLTAQADKIRDAALRRSFLENDPVNARTLALANELA